jgi:hypothetical protein
MAFAQAAKACIRFLLVLKSNLRNPLPKALRQAKTLMLTKSNATLKSFVWIKEAI